MSWPYIIIMYCTILYHNVFFIPAGNKSKHPAEKGRPLTPLKPVEPLERSCKSVRPPKASAR